MKQTELRMTARRDFRVYAFLLVGAVFVYAGATVDPAKNCDESGRECAPWLVPIAFGMGVIAVAAGVLQLWHNRRWGSRIDIRQRRLHWWDSAATPDAGSIALDDVSMIKVQRGSESDDKIFLYDRAGTRFPFPDQQSVPYRAEQWATDLAAHFPHISVIVEE